MTLWCSNELFVEFLVIVFGFLTFCAFFIFSVNIKPIIFSCGILPHLLEASLPKPAVLLLQTGLPAVQLAFWLLPALPVPCLLYQLDPYNTGLTP